MKQILSLFPIAVVRFSKKQIVHNASMLYLLNAAQLVFPLFTFPYLTRVLSIEGYAVMAYVRAIMLYMNMWVGFGFLLSATKRIVQAKDTQETGHIVSDTILARILLWVSGTVVLGGMCCTISLLCQNLLFTWLSYGTVFLSCFMMDYLFRGIEKMHEITIRFVTMKSISTILTFLLVHSDKDLLRIPLLDILSSLVALVLIYFQLSKYNVRLVMPSLSKAWEYLKESFEYFLSEIATTAFGALNTLLIGIFLPGKDVAVWAVALQLIAMANSAFRPIISAIYPNMVRNKHFGLIKKVLCLIVPLIFINCLFCYFASPFIIHLAAGTKYLDSVPIFRLMLPVLLFSFPAMMLGWPSLGAIGKIRQTTFTTIIAACVQCVGLCVLILSGTFSLISVAIMRNISEALLLCSRAGFVYKFRKEFK